MSQVGNAMSSEMKFTLELEELGISLERYNILQKKLYTEETFEQI